MKHRNFFQITIIAGLFLCALGTFNLSIAETAGLQSDTPLLILHEGQKEYLLGTYVEYLEDPSQTLSIEQVSSSEYDGKFIRGDMDILNFGFKDSAYWLRLTVRNESKMKSNWFLDLSRPSMHSVFLYTPSLDGNKFIETKTGYFFPFATRDVPHENFVFNLDIAPGNENTYYLRVESFSINLPLRIWSDDAFGLHDQTSRVIISLSFGAMLVIMLFNVILLFSLRDRGYLYYVFFQLFLLLGLGSFLGYAPRYLWPNTTYFNFFSLPLCLEGVVIFTLLFSWDFLSFDSRPKWIDYICYILIVIMVFSIPPTFKIGTKIMTVLFPLALVVSLYALLLGVWALWRGYKPARYYLFAWSIFFIIALAAITQNYGVFTATQVNLEQAVQLGAVYLVTFHSLALADRIKHYRQKHLNAQDKLIHHQQETLNLKDKLNRTLENARLELEGRVTQRTRELTELNTQLSKEIAQRKRAQNKLRRLANTDPLTGVNNRRYFMKRASEELERIKRFDYQISLMLLDIDQFKVINDTYGHKAGDEVLKSFAKHCLSNLRPFDQFARLGGDEFIALLVQVDQDNAKKIADRLRASIERLKIKINKKTITATVSIGMATTTDNILSVKDLIKHADEALYKAKNRGRNQITIMSIGIESPNIACN